MESVQLYETTVADRDAQLSVRFITVPTRAIPEPTRAPDAIETIEGWASALNLRLMRTVDVISYTPVAIAAMLQHPNDVEAAEQAFVADDFDWTRQVIDFSEFVAFAPVIAAEGSPLDAHSLAGIAKTGTAATVGPAVALAAFGATPLLFVAAPIGIVICGAAIGVGQALERGLRQLILRRLGVDEEAPAEHGVGI